MPKVTLIGEDLAHKDNEFIFLGPLQDCKDCKLTHICFNLKPFYRYKIVKIRKKKHSCGVHQSKAYVVEVKEQPIIVAIDKKHTKGSTLSIEKKQCGEKFCQYYDFCQAPALKPHWKYKILSVIDDNIDCRKKFSLQIVELTE